jgi:hypothetical protein
MAHALFHLVFIQNELMKGIIEIKKVMVVQITG